MAKSNPIAPKMEIVRKGISRISGKPHGSGPGTDDSQTASRSLFEKFLRRLKEKKDIQLPRR